MEKDEVELVDVDVRLVYHAEGDQWHVVAQHTDHSLGVRHVTDGDMYLQAAAVGLRCSDEPVSGTDVALR